MSTPAALDVDNAAPPPDHLFGQAGMRLQLGSPAMGAIQRRLLLLMYVRVQTRLVASLARHIPDSLLQPSFRTSQFAVETRLSGSVDCFAALQPMFHAVCDDTPWLYMLTVYYVTYQSQLFGQASLTFRLGYPEIRGGMLRCRPLSTCWGWSCLLPAHVVLASVILLPSTRRTSELDHETGLSEECRFIAKLQPTLHAHRAKWAMSPLPGSVRPLTEC